MERNPGGLRRGSRMLPRVGRRRARAALAWAAGLLLAALAAGAAAVDACYPELNDAEFGRQLRALRARRAERPGRPVLAVVGSSRTAMAFAPEELPPLRDAAGAEVLPFNASHFGAGPVMNLLHARRLLASDARPRWLVVELMPLYLTFE